MNKFVFLFLISIGLVSCNDGDVITTSFNFDEANLASCIGSSSYVFYKINTSSLESLSLRIAESENIYLESAVLNYSLNETDNFVNYRIFNNAVSSAYFCAEIPPTSPSINRDFLATSGNAEVTVVTTLDDEDNVDEDPTSDLDTDGDLLLDYYDFDDDGDNVPTATELGDNDPATEPRDTDGDGIPDYLDDDDDNDGILTRYEDADMDLNPANDIDDINVGPNYLNAAVANSVTIDEYRDHVFSLSSDMSLILMNVVLISGEETITKETINMDGIDNVFSIISTITPEFQN